MISGRHVGKRGIVKGETPIKMHFEIDNKIVQVWKYNVEAFQPTPPRSTMDHPAPRSHTQSHPPDSVTHPPVQTSMHSFFTPSSAQALMLTQRSDPCLDHVGHSRILGDARYALSAQRPISRSLISQGGLCRNILFDLDCSATQTSTPVVTLPF